MTYHFQTFDLVNGCFELFGGALNWMNVRALWRDKKLRGVSMWPAIGFTAWGLFNCFYYPHLEQMLSFTGGLVIFGANIVWVGLAIRYRKN